MKKERHRAWFYFTRDKQDNQMEKGPSKTITRPPTRLSLHTDLDKTIVTVDGLVISILAGFMISTKTKDLIIIDAFFIIIVSLILALTAPYIYRKSNSNKA